MMLGEMRKIWWLASFPKSGNTWVRMFVNCYATGWPIDLNAAFQYATGDLQRYAYQTTAGRPISEFSGPEMVYYRPAVLMNFICGAGGRDVCLKTHHAKVSMDVDTFPLIPPKLTKGAIYILRDPRDVAPSLAHHLGKGIDETIDLMTSNEFCLSRSHNLYHVCCSWSSHVDSWTVGNKDVRTRIVQYEDLVNQPEVEFRAVLEGLGFAEIDEERFRFALEQTEFERMKKREQDSGFRENGKGDRFFRKGKIGGWREELTAEQVCRIEEAFGNTMRRWGYETSEVAA